MKDLIIDKAFFDKNGYYLVKNVFSPEEIALFREEAYKQYEIDRQKQLTFQMQNMSSKALYSKGDLLSKELLRHVLLDDRILKIVRTILGNNDLVYFGDSSYQIGTGLRGFHRDNVDREFGKGQDWEGEYTLVRLGIYLQNHKKYSGGLKVKPGTHKSADGPSVFVDTEAGDVAIWDLKTMHSGNAVRVKGLKGFSIDKSTIENRIPAFLKKDQQLERISFFMTFALKSKHLDRYINEYTLKRKDTIEHAKSSKFDSSVVDLAGSKNVQILKPIPEYGA